MSERECDRAAARIAPPANNRPLPHKRQPRNLCRGRRLDVPKTNAYHRTNGKPEKRDEQARPLQTNFYRKTSPAVILSVLSEMREKSFANPKTESPRRISRRSMFAQTCVFLWRLCIRNSSFARGKLLYPFIDPIVIPRACGLLHSSVLLRSRHFVASRLRKTSTAGFALRSG